MTHVPPTVSDVDRIATFAEPIMRNLRITHCYHELSLALSARTGGAANWCTFAVWASKEVGQTIRQEDLTDTFERLLRAMPEAAAVAELVVRALRRAAPRALVLQAVVAVARLDAVSAAAARGNQKVFEEIAREFARFLTTFADEPADPQQIKNFCDGLRPGEPPEGQRYLRQAFTRYYRALSTADPKQRAELLLLANLEIGLHEQMRLQPEITAAIEAPVVDPAELQRRILELLFPGNGLRKRLRLALARLLGWRHPVRVACEQLADYARVVTRRTVTEHLMTLSLPGGQHLDLGDDLPATFPPLLAELSDPELLALLATVGPTPDSLLDTAARDWSDLPDRMHYIADMFRCFAQRADLLEPPFTAEQVEAIRTGKHPTGDL